MQMEHEKCMEKTFCSNARIEPIHHRRGENQSQVMVNDNLHARRNGGVEKRQPLEMGML